MTASRICSGRRSARPADVGVADSGKTGEELTVVGFGKLIELMGCCQRGARCTFASAAARNLKRNSRKKAQKAQKNRQIVFLLLEFAWRVLSILTVLHHGTAQIRRGYDRFAWHHQRRPRDFRPTFFAFFAPFCGYFSVLRSRRVYCLHQIRQRFLGIAVKHLAVWLKEERINQPGETFSLPSF
jgi:hypothetical protein